MKKTLSTLLVLVSSLGAIAQDDSTIASILPYYPPLHSDRPGATNDAVSMKSGMILQLGGSLRDDFFETALGTDDHFETNTATATLRMATCIGEIDARISYSQAEDRYLSHGSIYTNVSRTQYTDASLTALYRPQLYEGETFTLNALIGASFISKNQNLARRAFSSDPNFQDLYYEQRLNTPCFGYEGYINSSISLNSNWSLNNSFGIYSNSGHLSVINALLTMNLSYSMQKWGFFAEGIFETDALSLTDGAYTQIGFTHNITRDFQLDCFLQSWYRTTPVDRSPSFQFLRSFSAGFTYRLQ